MSCLEHLQGLGSLLPRYAPIPAQHHGLASLPADPHACLTPFPLSPFSTPGERGEAPPEPVTEGTYWGQNQQNRAQQDSQEWTGCAQDQSTPEERHMGPLQGQPATFSVAERGPRSAHYWERSHAGTQVLVQESHGHQAPGLPAALPAGTHPQAALLGESQFAQAQPRAPQGVGGGPCFTVSLDWFSSSEPDSEQDDVASLCDAIASQAFMSQQQGLQRLRQVGKPSLGGHQGVRPWMYPSASLNDLQDSSGFDGVQPRVHRQRPGLGGPAREFTGTSTPVLATETGEAQCLSTSALSSSEPSHGLPSIVEVPTRAAHGECQHAGTAVATAPSCEYYSTGADGNATRVPLRLMSCASKPGKEGAQQPEKRIEDGPTSLEYRLELLGLQRQICAAKCELFLGMLEGRLQSHGEGSPSCSAQGTGITRSRHSLSTASPGEEARSRHRSPRTRHRRRKAEMGQRRRRSMESIWLA